MYQPFVSLPYGASSTLASPDLWLLHHLEPEQTEHICPMDTRLIHPVAENRPSPLPQGLCVFKYIFSFHMDPTAAHNTEMNIKYFDHLATPSAEEDHLIRSKAPEQLLNV